MLPRRVTAVVVYVTTAGWAANLIASMVPWLGYTSDPLIHAAFMAIVGGAVGLQARQPRQPKENEES
jgi:hypothetical protein